QLKNHAPMVARYALCYNFVRTHKILRASPAMAAIGDGGFGCADRCPVGKGRRRNVRRLNGILFMSDISDIARMIHLLFGPLLWGSVILSMVLIFFTIVGPPG